MIYIFIRLRIIMHPYSYKGYYRVNREIISRTSALFHSVVDMNQTHVEDDTMPFEQNPVRMRNHSFIPVSRNENNNDDHGITDWI